MSHVDTFYNNFVSSKVSSSAKYNIYYTSSLIKGLKLYLTLFFTSTLMKWARKKTIVLYLVFAANLVYIYNSDIVSEKLEDLAESGFLHPLFFMGKFKRILQNRSA